MSGDIGHLQRLTEQQVASRLSSYGEDGRFEAAAPPVGDRPGTMIERGPRTISASDVAT